MHFLKKIKISIYQENIMILNVHVPKNRASKYRKQNLTDLKRHTEKSTIIVGNFNIPPSATDRTTRKKISKAVADLNNQN